MITSLRWTKRKLAQERTNPSMLLLGLMVLYARTITTEATPNKFDYRPMSSFPFLTPPHQRTPQPSGQS